MRKLFRFKYEPCNGTCYSHNSIFFSEMKKLSEVKKEELVNLIVKAHDKLCDNPDYYFGLDLCENTRIFVGHFIQPDSTDIFTGLTLEECIKQVCSYVINTDIPVLPGICEFGNSGTENLAEQILNAC